MKGLLLCIPLLAACGGTPQLHVVKDAAGHTRAEVTRVHGRKEGPVRFFHPDGTLEATGQYVDDARHGTWASLGARGDTLALVRYRHGRKDGLQAYWAPGGQLLRLECFRKGTPDGPLYRFFTDGSPRQVTWYRAGLAEGVYMEWYKVDSTSVALTAGRFHKGERTGRWTWFYGNGKPQRQGHYASGKPVGTWRHWDAQGNLLKTADHGK